MTVYCVDKVWYLVSLLLFIKLNIHNVPASLFKLIYSTLRGLTHILQYLITGDRRFAAYLGRMGDI